MSLRIIIADDHTLIRLGTRRVIELCGVGTIVAEASSAEELLNVLKEHPCDVLVTDLAMPDGQQADGLSMITVVRRRHPDLPILLLTAATNLGLLRAARSVGVLGLLDKGSTTSELSTAIQTVYRGLPYIGSGIKDRFASSSGATETGLLNRIPSPREMEVLRLLASGLTVTEIAAKLHRSITTISRQKSNAKRKLGIGNEVELFERLRSEKL
ncbi:response regulator [Stenotrophomonas sp. PD6]|uniref:response regulator n=1 Tax=Stenotrophomonas sp. PD6 TaxID=3368612 RepID=UPI003BA1CA0E